MNPHWALAIVAVGAPLLGVLASLAGPTRARGYGLSVAAAGLGAGAGVGLLIATQKLGVPGAAREAGFEAVGAAALALVAVASTVLALAAGPDADPRERAAGLWTQSLVSLACLASSVPLAALLVCAGELPLLARPRRAPLPQLRRAQRHGALQHAAGALLIALASIAQSSATLPLWAGLALLLGAWLRLAAVPLQGGLLLPFQHAPLAQATLIPLASAALLLRAVTSFSSAEPFGSLADLALYAAVLTAAFGAVLGFAATQLRRWLGCIALTQSGWLWVALSRGGGESSVATLVVTALALGLALTGLAVVVDATERRLGTGRVSELGGVGRSAPGLATSFLILGLAAVGLPGTLGFVSETLLLSELMREHPFAAVGLTVSSALTAVHMLAMYVRVYLGPRERTALPDLRHAERGAIILVGCLLFGLGLHPSTLAPEPRPSSVARGWQDRAGAGQHIERSVLRSPDAPTLKRVPRPSGLP